MGQSPQWEVSMSAAQSRPFWRKQTAAKPFMSTVDCVCTIAAWSDFEDSAVKASATAEKPTSNRQLPRRDWQ